MAKEKTNVINTPYLYEEISEIANEAINAITTVVEEDIPNKHHEFTKKIVDALGKPILRIYYDENEDDVLIDTEECMGSRLREEPLNIIMDVADYLNFAIFDIKPY